MHPEAAKIENVYLFNIDHLETIVSQNLAERAKEIAHSEPIIEDETEAFMAELATTDIGGLLSELRGHVQNLGREELERTLAKLDSLPQEHRKEVEELVHRLVSKILHSPTTVLRDEVANGKGHRLAELTRKLFGLK